MYEQKNPIRKLDSERQKEVGRLTNRVAKMKKAKLSLNIDKIPGERETNQRNLLEQH